ncbi:MAG: antitoxin family protein [Methanospirillum sp.]
MAIVVEARYEDGVLKPVDELPLRDGEEVIVEVKRSLADRMYGAIPLDESTADELIKMEPWE